MNEPPDYEDVDKGNVLVFRNTAGEPIAVPDDVVTAAERAYRCYNSRTSGMSWTEIARREGYPSAAAAHYDVTRYMNEAKALVVEASQREMLTLEVARLDSLQQAVWPGAMAGHVPSATLAMNIVINRARLVGLDPDKIDDRANQVRTTVVVPPEDGAYLRALQRAAAQATPNGNTVSEQQDRPEQGESNGNVTQEHGPEHGADPGD